MADGDPTGADLTSGTTDGSTLAVYGSWTEREITFDTPLALISGTKYAIVVRPETLVGAGELYWSVRVDNPTANGDEYDSSDSGSSWTISTDDDVWFKTKASAVEKDDGSFVQDGFNRASSPGLTDWVAQTFIASSSYTLTSVVLKLTQYQDFGGSVGTVTVSIRATESAPGKATTPGPADDQEDLLITGRDRLLRLTWVAPAGETPDYLIYFRAEGGAWVLQETITDDSTSHTLSSGILDAFSYYSIYEWRVDTRENAVTTTGDTWTFITQRSAQFTDYTRRSDYDADKVWQPGTGWVDINTFENVGGGRFKGRVLVVGHKVLYFGDL